MVTNKEYLQTVDIKNDLVQISDMTTIDYLNLKQNISHQVNVLRQQKRIYDNLPLTDKITHIPEMVKEQNKLKEHRYKLRNWLKEEINLDQILNIKINVGRKRNGNK